MTAPTASTMAPRTVATAVMDLRQSAFALVYHYLYNQTGVFYNQPGFMYNYYQEKGNMDPRNITGPTMEGRL